MSHLLRLSIRALGLTSLLAGAVSAQAAPKACEVNESRPSAVGRAFLAVQTASTTQNPDVAKKQLGQAMKLLTTNGDKMDNQPGRNFVLGKALVLWSMQPNMGLDSKRGALGITENPDATMDLAASIDSAFKVVEAAMPECVAETSRWRGQKPWVDMVNLAIEKLNADETDAAETAASRAITLNPFAPYGYVVLANVKQRRQQSTEAFVLYRKSVEIASRDTLYDDIRRQSLIYLGTLAADSAEMASDSVARMPYLNEARSAFEAILADKGAGDAAATARAGMCRIAIATGDTASLRRTYSGELALPASAVYAELINAGVCMARAEMVREATLLFQGAYERNPYHRDALANLAIMFLQQELHDRSLPLAERLVTVEPNNPENIQLLVLSYAGLATRARAARTAAMKASTPTPATKAGSKAPATKTAPAAPPAPRMSADVADSIFKVEQRYTALAVSTNERKDSLALKVQLSDFSILKGKATLQGTVSLTPAAKNADGDYLLKCDFLDASGGVVVGREAKVTVSSERAGRFKFEASDSAIAAFRYSISPAK